MKTIADHFEYQKNRKSDINQHLDTLYQLSLECDHITEMGVRNVVSTWSFLHAHPKKLVSIDIRSCPVAEAEQLAKEAGIEFEFIKADTAKCEIEPTDLLFIDTWHVYNLLQIELSRHASKASKYIVMHDTTTFGDRGEPQYRGDTVVRAGLWKAIEEFLDQHEDWVIKERYTHNNGLTILKRK